MFTPTIRIASEILLDFFGLYLYARLLADKAVKHLAESFAAAQKLLRTANDEEREAYRARRIAQAKLDFAGFLLDRAVVEFESALYVFVGKQRSAFEYKRFFPKGLRAVNQVSLDRELDAVRRIESDLASGSLIPEAAKWLATLTEARIACEAAKAERVAAETAYGIAFRAEVSARNKWQAAYRVIYGKLTEAFPQDRKRLESYFASKKGAKDEGPEVDPLTLTAPATGAAPEALVG